MEFKDYYATLGVSPSATQDEIKQAYRKLARKYHPDVSKEPDAEARFKEVAEAHEALSDADRRADYDEAAADHRRGRRFRPPPRGAGGFDFGGPAGASGPAQRDHSDFFDALFSRQRAGPRPGADHHAKVQIDLVDVYRGGRRSISLSLPQANGRGHVTHQPRQLDVNIPKGVRTGQQLRLAGLGAPGQGGGAAGDLYLEIEIAPQPQFRVEGRDVYLDLPVAPWEAALGATVTVATPDGSVQLTVPAGSSTGRSLRLKGQGLPSVPPGDLYARVSVVLPPADTSAAEAAYRAMESAFEGFDARRLAAT